MPSRHPVQRSRPRTGTRRRTAAILGYDGQSVTPTHNDHLLLPPTLFILLGEAVRHEATIISFFHLHFLSFRAIDVPRRARTYAKMPFAVNEQGPSARMAAPFAALLFSSRVSRSFRNFSFFSMAHTQRGRATMTRPGWTRTHIGSRTRLAGAEPAWRFCVPRRSAGVAGRGNKWTPMTRFATTSVACTRIRRCHANARWAPTNVGGPTTGETISSGSMLRDRRRQIVFAPAISDVAPGDVGRTGRPLDGERVIGAVRLRAGDVYGIHTFRRRTIVRDMRRTAKRG